MSLWVFWKSSDENKMGLVFCHLFVCFKGSAMVCLLPDESNPYSFFVILNSVSCCLTVEGRDNDKRRVSRSVCCPNAFLVLWRRFSAWFFVKKKEKKSVTSTLTSLRFQQTTFKLFVYLVQGHFSLKYTIRKGFLRTTLKTG